ncbi:MAG TPA: hypothetical protein VFG29_07020 [Syntrophales bacterium]|nr:hypothetical protein [Syntrophales bacterium]
MKNFYEGYSEKVEVDELPNCIFCGKEAGYNARTEADLWCYLCEKCFMEYGLGLGPAEGQMLVLKSKSIEVLSE